MNDKPIRPLKSVVLLSTPWPIFNRPSIQLGTLKSYLKLQFPELEIVAHHFYLKLAETIGYKLYHAISKKTWLAETVYAALLYPERLESIKKLFIKEAKGKPLLRDVDFKDMTKRVAKVTDEFIDNANWNDFGLAGFSICLCQLTSNLYFIRCIKQKSPDLPIVVGGSMFTGISAKNLLKMFPEINFVIIGEGELPVSRLVRNLKDSPMTVDNPFIPGIVTAKEMNIENRVGFSQVEDLADIPVPDYDDYFNLLKSFKQDKTFFPTLPAEISRGCWWKGASAYGEKKSGCAFCNLNLQWEGYRSKNAGQVTAEFAMSFRPMKFVHFWLGLESPVWQNPNDFGIKAVFNHTNYATLFPPDIYRQMVFMIQAYRGNLGYQRKLWQPVKRKVREWKKAYDEIHNGYVHSPILSYRNGRDFLIIRQRRLSAEPLTHRLEGMSREIYLFCGHHRSLKRILNQFSRITEGQVIPFLKMMVDKKLMFKEKNQYLSLAVSVS